MSPLFALVLAFVASGAGVVGAGVALARYGDAIAERTGMGRVWLGAVLLAGATSLPELATDVTAVRIGAADLAFGDIFGSCMANMLILGLIDLVHPRRRVLRSATFDHALAATLAITLLALATVYMLVPPSSTAHGVTIESLSLVVIYIAGARVVFRHVTRTTPGAVQSEAAEVRSAEGTPSLRRAVAGFSVAALVIVVVAPLFARAAEGLAEVTGLGATFMGTWAVGFATSLPELVASIAAVRMGAFDLAVGNLFGSNAFNIVIIFALDVAHTGGPIFAAVSAVHVLSAIFSILLTALGLAAIIYRGQQRFKVVEPDALLIVATYCAAMWTIFMRTRVG